MGSSRLAEVLERIESAVRAGELPMVVFDLDSTLFATAHRNLRILHEFAGAHAERWPRLPHVVEQLGVADMGWQVLDPLRARGVDDPELASVYLPFWKDRFFTDEYVLSDQPNAGAVEFAVACHDRGAFLYYLTGRHVGGMEVGTVRSLTLNGFPYWRGRALLHLKPDFETLDEPYKAEALADIRSHAATVVATFENEPGNANLFLKAFPDALHFLLLTEHSPTAPPPDPGLVLTEDFVLPR